MTNLRTQLDRARLVELPQAEAPKVAQKPQQNVSEDEFGRGSFGQQKGGDGGVPGIASFKGVVGLLGGEPPLASRYPAHALVGQNYRDPGIVGSFILETRADPSTQIVLDSNAVDPSGKVKVFVTSTKDIKTEPAKDFVLKLMREKFPEFSADQIEVIGLKCPVEGVHEQPVFYPGRDKDNEGVRGAVGRCEFGPLREQFDAIKTQQAALAAQGQKSAPAFVVSFENYFSFEPVDLSKMPLGWIKERGAEYVKNGRVPVDIAAIHVKAAVGGQEQSTTGFSDGVAAPQRFLEESKKTGYDVTAGKFIAAELNVDDANWHGDFTSVDRPTFLTIGVEKMIRGKDQLVAWA